MKRKIVFRVRLDFSVYPRMRIPFMLGLPREEVYRDLILCGV